MNVRPLPVGSVAAGEALGEVVLVTEGEAATLRVAEGDGETVLLSLRVAESDGETVLLPLGEGETVRLPLGEGEAVLLTEDETATLRVAEGEGETVPLPLGEGGRVRLPLGEREAVLLSDCADDGRRHSSAAKTAAPRAAMARGRGWRGGARGIVAP